MRANNQEQGLTLPTFSEYLKDIPFWSRLLYITLPAVWFIGLFTDLPSTIFPSNLNDTIYRFQLWRLITSLFYVDSLFLAFLVIINFHTFLPKLELRISSIVLIIKFILTNFLIQVICAFSDWLFGLSTYGEDSVKVVNFGVAGVWFYFLTKYCYYNCNRKIKMCCFDWRFDKKYYPALLFIVLTLLRFQINIEMAVGLLLAFTETIILTDGIAIPKAHYECFENGAIKIRLGTFACWKSFALERVPYVLTDKCIFQNLQNYSLSSFNSTSELQKSKDDVFAKKGYRLDQI